MNRNEWKGETVLIIGSGPSVNDFNVDALHEFRTIGINQISRRMDPDIITLMDAADHMGEGMKYCLRSLIRAEVLVSACHQDTWHRFRDMPAVVDKDMPPIHAIEFEPHHEWNKWEKETYRAAVAAWPDEGPPTQLPFGYTSLSVACWLAAFMGAFRVGIIGMDHGPDYFFKSVKPHAMNGDLTFDHAQIHFDHLSRYIVELTGTEIYNLSEQSQITTIPMADFVQWQVEASR